ncbi:hypothetical protein M404DRAFT_426812 [Pisolithus tinctorius Marx 270]|uniref:Uncharacterized protein n=1 Tax=Pisolithus tinctorius Marx 270 TaxID=870435 RepID=A0A0C3PFH2_PISTI|nr:hypothetical protein M404DRAFT_426812 [Pisolithus tinctorius Marx 270]
MCTSYSVTFFSSKHWNTRILSARPNAQRVRVSPGDAERHCSQRVAIGDSRRWCCMAYFVW